MLFFQCVFSEHQFWLRCRRYGTILKSEKEAFERTLTVAKEIVIKDNSLRLDKYYSAEAYVKICQEILGNVKMHILPKKNIATFGVGEWCRMIYAFTDDKKRTGWRFTQKR